MCGSTEGTAASCTVISCLHFINSHMLTKGNENIASTHLFAHTHTQTQIHTVPNTSYSHISLKDPDCRLRTDVIEFGKQFLDCEKHFPTRRE